MADNLQILPEDLVFVKLTVRSRDNNEPFDLEEAVRVSDLPFAADGDNAAAAADLTGAFDPARFAELMASGDDSKIQEALQMQADFTEKVADHVAGGGKTQAERLAEAVVSWAEETSPKGKTFTRDANSEEGYILNEREINIQGPTEMGDERVWRVSAVGTWG